MANLTSKELSAIEDQLASEATAVKKLRMYAAQCPDAQVKTKCEQLAQKHQQHFNSLMSLLNQG